MSSNHAPEPILKGEMAGRKAIWFMHLKRLPLLAIAILLVLALIVAFNHFSRASAAMLNLPPPLNHPTIMFDDGMPTIPPGRNGTLLGPADVQHYILTHPFPGGPTVSHKPPEIETLLLTTSERASSLMGGGIHNVIEYRSLFCRAERPIPARKHVFTGRFQ